MADLRFVHDHNMTAFLGKPPAKHSEFQSMIEGLILSPVNYAIMEYPQIVTSFIRDFWSSVEESIDADGNISIVGKIQGHPITISEQIIRDCLQFGDKESDPVELDQELVNKTVYQMGHEGAYPPTEKKLLHPSSGKDPAFQMEGQGFDSLWAHLMDIQVMEQIWALSRVRT
ncbi:hypothetical protein E3N88_29432 [Mikania micrantha]|uniref:Uncharacterized protein n=1 Tax=Mikania micrantha TaxID=192012 RepID=A0A5N6MJN7_9ASTR|nr:hypothetical protein E3N88_29432 [Mikania micrantha]